MAQWCLSLLPGSIMVAVAGYVIWRSVDLWRNTDSLDPNSWAYRRYVSWMRTYQYGKWKERARSARVHWRYGDYDRFRASKKWKDWHRPVVLTREDIVAFAGLELIGGVLMLCIGLSTLVSGWLI